MTKPRKQRKSSYEDLILEHWGEVCYDNPLPRAKDYSVVIANYRNIGVVGNPYSPDGIHTQVGRALKRLTEGPDPFMVQEGKVFLPSSLKNRERIGAKINQDFNFAQPHILTVSETVVAISFAKRVTSQLKMLFKTYCGKACYDVVSIDTLLLIFFKEAGTDIVFLNEHRLLKKQLEKLVLKGYYDQNPLLQKPDQKPALQTQSLPKLSNLPSSTDIPSLPYKPFSK